MPLREFKKKPPPVRWAWVVAILIALVLVGTAGFGLYSLVTWML